MTTFNPVQKLHLSDKTAYVVGDIHGRFDLLTQLLDEVNFEPSSHVLIACGDIIDRGPQSFEAFKLLENDWFYSVRGNHEALLFDFFDHYFQSGYIVEDDFDEDSLFISNGGDWVKQHIISNTMTDEFEKLVLLAKKLPYVICVDMNDTRFNVIHAEATRPMALREESILWGDSDFDLWHASSHIPPSACQHLLWGRTIMHGYHSVLKNIPDFDGLSNTYCGHTPYHIGALRRALSHSFVDTGAFLSSNNGNYGLTMVNTMTQEKYVAIG